MNNFSARLKYAMQEKNIRMTDLARRAGVAKSSLSDWLSGRYEAKQENVFLLAEALEVDEGWLMGLDVPMNKVTSISALYDQLDRPRQRKVYKFAEQQLKEQKKVVVLNETQTVYLNSKLSAGTGILDLDPSDTKEVEYNGFVPKHDLAFEVAGNSMEPSFEDGEIVFVEKTPDIHSGQFIAVQINEEAYIKKAYIEDERLRLVSLNRDYKDIFACGDDNIRVIGRIIL